MSLFGNENKSTKPMKLRINKDFAQKFEHKKRREHIEKTKNSKLKEIFQEKEEQNSKSGSSSSNSEDENGELINEDLMHDFVKSLAKIREKKPEIYNKNTQFFSNEYVGDGNKKEKKSSFFYKDMVREDILNENFEEEPTKSKDITDETPVEEQIRLKREFQKASKLDREDDNFFSIKTKTQKEIEDENGMFDQFLKEEARKNRPDEVEMLKRFWGGDAKLDETDKFLRRYIMTKGWVDEDFNDNLDIQIDKEDEERDEEIEEYEEKFNFRFEEPDSNKLITYGRDIPESLRKKNDTRTDKRKEKLERRKEEKKKMEEEIKQLKKIKKEEIFDRLTKIQKIGGTQKFTEEFQDFLEKEFDPKVYDKEMNENFDEKYYKEEDENEEDLKDYLEEIKKNEKEFLEQNEKKFIESDKVELIKKNEDKENVLIPKTSIPIILKNNLNKSEIKEIKETAKTLLWWYCDMCSKGIKELEPHFDCLECEDYTVCKKCHDLKGHDHKMRKNLVPEGCIPPSDEEILKIISQFKICQFCKLKLSETDGYYFEKNKENSVLCDICIQNLDFKAKRNYDLKEPENDIYVIADKDPHKLKDIVNDDELKKLVDDYYALDFEDIIAGGIKTKFKYTNVESEDFGLNDELLLYTDDKLLNNYVSLKNIAPYQNKKSDINQRSLKKKKNLLEKNAQENKKMLKKQLKKIEKYESDMKKMKPKTKTDIKKQKILKKKIDKLKTSSLKTLKKQEGEENKIEIENLENNDNKTSKNNSNITNQRLKSYGMMNAPKK